MSIYTDEGFINQEDCFATLAEHYDVLYCEVEGVFGTLTEVRRVDDLAEAVRIYAESLGTL